MDNCALNIYLNALYCQKPSLQGWLWPVLGDNRGYTFPRVAYAQIKLVSYLLLMS